jgi:hypothetical protein
MIRFLELAIILKSNLCSFALVVVLVKGNKNAYAARKIN